MTCSNVRSAITTKPTDLAVARHYSGQLIRGNFFSVSQRTTRTRYEIHLVNVLVHMPLKRVIILLDHTNATDKSTFITEFLQLLTLTTLIFGIEIFHRRLMSRISAFEHIIYLDQNKSIVEDTRVGTSRWQGHHALVIRVPHIA